jgi:ABC-type Fe3+/spermidine/putrescine transport system ATPase subunit
MATLTVEGLSRSFTDEVLAVRDVSFTVEDGRVAALLGASGAGKTSVLRLIAGLDEPDSGDIRLDGRSVRDVPAHRRGVGLMFQELALFPHMNVRDNVAFGLRMAGQSRPERAQRVAAMLGLVGLSEFGGRRIDELSGGERQRVALARTLAPQPAVLLLDEPLGAIDEERKRFLRGELRSLLRAVGTTALIVSHDIRDAVAIADDVVVMDRGAVLQAGALADVVAQPRTPEVASMFGYITLLAGTVEGGAVVEPGVGALTLPADWKVRGQVRVMAHASTLRATPEGAEDGCGVRGRVIASQPDGPLHVLELAIGDRQALVRWDAELAPPAAGTLLDVVARPDTLRFFEAGTGDPGQRSQSAHVERPAASEASESVTSE